jgi:hypothetical protein
MKKPKFRVSAKIEKNAKMTFSRFIAAAPGELYFRI